MLRLIGDNFDSHDPQALIYQLRGFLPLQTDKESGTRMFGLCGFKRVIKLW